jgi:RNA polymerase sigma-70 factor (ECF subfamily)
MERKGGVVYELKMAMIERNKAPARQDFFLNLEERLTAPSSDNTLLQKDLNQQVAQIVCGLPEKCQQIYRLSREEYLSHREIAQKLNISTKTVENQLTIALRRLRLSLGECFFFDHSSFYTIENTFF